MGGGQVDRSGGGTGRGRLYTGQQGLEGRQYLYRTLCVRIRPRGIVGYIMGIVHKLHVAT